MTTKTKTEPTVTLKLTADEAADLAHAAREGALQGGQHRGKATDYATPIDETVRNLEEQVEKARA